MLKAAFALVDICEVNQPVTGGFPSQKSSKTKPLSFCFCLPNKTV